MISLVFIPIFCLYYLFLTNSFNDYRSIQIYFPSNKDEINFIKNNKQIYPRKYSNFDFNNTLFVEEQKLKKLQISVRYLNKSKDLKNGINWILDNNEQLDFKKECKLLIEQKFKTKDTINKLKKLYQMVIKETLPK